MILFCVRFLFHFRVRFMTHCMVIASLVSDYHVSVLYLREFLFYHLFMCLSLCLFFVVFFFKQKTAYEMRISDWSSDVCSSDLQDCHRRQLAAALLVKPGERLQIQAGSHGARSYLYRQPGNSVARTDRSGSWPLICRSLRTSVACNRFSGERHVATHAGPLRHQRAGFCALPAAYRAHRALAATRCGRGVYLRRARGADAAASRRSEDRDCGSRREKPRCRRAVAVDARQARDTGWQSVRPLPRAGPGL